MLAAADDAEFFETRIRPLLATNCHSCHSEGGLGGLRLDSREAVLKGGKSGAVVVAGKPDDSLLMQAVRRTHVRLKMPPVGALAETEVEALAEWIRRGLPWPEHQEKEVVTATSIVVVASETVGPTRCAIEVATGMPENIDMPRSPCRVDQPQLANCCSKGRSSPRLLRMRAMFSAVALSPAMMAAGSPGARCSKEKTKTPTTTMTGTTPSRRRTM